MGFTFLKFDISSRIATVTLNRPEKRNALNGALVAELHEAVRLAGSGGDVRVVILRGAGGVFSAGADLAYLQQIARNSPIENGEDSMRLMRMLHAWKRCPKPTVAVVEGHALAGGCGLAAACDFILCSEEAQFGFTEVRIGFVPAVVARLLIDRIGKMRAADLLLRGRIIPAPEALAISLVNEILPKDALSARAAELAREFVEKTSPQAVALTKELLREIDPLDLEEAMSYAANINALSRTTEDFKKGIASFLEKKKITWDKE